MCNWLYEVYYDSEECEFDGVRVWLGIVTMGLGAVWMWIVSWLVMLLGIWIVLRVAVWVGLCGGSLVGCRINCSAITNAGLILIWRRVRFIWDLCRFRIDALVLSTVPTYRIRLGNNGTTSCIFSPWYAWNTSVLGSQIDSTLIINAVSSASLLVCTCSDNFIFQNNLCVYLPLDCTLIPYANNSHSGNNSCSCQDTFIWDSIQRLCVRNCSGISKTNGSLNTSTCNCIAGFICSGSQ